MNVQESSDEKETDKVSDVRRQRHGNQRVSEGKRGFQSPWSSSSWHRISLAFMLREVSLDKDGWQIALRGVGSPVDTCSGLGDTYRMPASTHESSQSRPSGETVIYYPRGLY